MFSKVMHKRQEHKLILFAIYTIKNIYEPVTISAIVCKYIMYLLIEYALSSQQRTQQCTK